MKPVIVVGAGFSGLTLAYALHRLKVPVQVVERELVPGGLIATRQLEYGLVETAANALLANVEVERLFADLDLEFATPLKVRKKRYIYWQKPKRWPVGLLTTLKMFKIAFTRWFGLSRGRPQAGESVHAWAHRTAGAQFEQRLLTPALQGVYAGDVQRMSAALVLARMFARGRSKGARRGSVAPVQGMGQLMERLTERLRVGGVSVEFGRRFELTSTLEQPVVICTSAWQAAEIVREHDPVLAEKLRACESLPLVSVTAFFEPRAKEIEGFGCLFPESQGFHALGVLFNDCIFAGRSAKRSETWIFGGAKHPELIHLSDEEMLGLLGKDRERLRGYRASPLAVSVTRWPKAIPHYTIEWEKTLAELDVRRPLFLHGNYLGSLGLAQIHERSLALAKQLKDLYVS